MIITKASIFDIDGIVRCGEDFFEYAKYADDGMPLDPETFGRKVAEYISYGVVLLLKDNSYGEIRGGIAGRIIDWSFNTNIKMMHEFFYWIDPGHRGISSVKLLAAFEKASKEAGANQIAMIKPETHLKDKVAKLYSHRGYRPLEEIWIKSI